MAAKHIKGGKKLKAFLRKAKAAKGVGQMEVGFYSTAKYPDGTPVTNVAAWNEFGFESKYFPVQSKDGTWIFIKRAKPKPIPERPFFRQAVARMDDRCFRADRTVLTPGRWWLPGAPPHALGWRHKLKCGIVLHRLQEPANADVTKEIKGSSNPFIDEGFMRQSVTFRIDG